MLNSQLIINVMVKSKKKFDRQNLELILSTSLNFNISTLYVFLLQSIKTLIDKKF